MDSTFVQHRLDDIHGGTTAERKNCRDSSPHNLSDPDTWMAGNLTVATTADWIDGEEVHGQKKHMCRNADPPTSWNLLILAP